MSTKFYEILFLSFLVNQWIVSAATPIIISVSTSYLKENYIREGSFEGGTLLYIKGNGFDTNKENIQIFIGVLDCSIEEANEIFLTCRTPPGSNDGLAQKLRVIVNKLEAICSSGIKCDFTFKSDKSPKLYYLWPRSTFSGNEIYFYGVFKVGSTNKINIFKLGDSLCDRFDYPIDSINWNDLIAIKCRVSPRMKGGLYTASTRSDEVGDPKKLFSLANYNNEARSAYEFACIPFIASVSSNKGSVKGQIISIYGSGFSNIQAEVTATADGLPCEVITADINKITCKVAEETRVKTSNFQIGQSGLLREVYNWTGSVSSVTPFKSALENIQNLPSLIKKEIIMESETFRYLDNYGQRIRGYFKAPKTGNYKFYISSDDISQLWLSSTPESNDRASLALIAFVGGPTSFRYYLKYPDQISKQIYLEADRYYLMEAYHVEGTSDDHLSIAVEVPNNEATKNNLYEISSFTISYQPTFEEVELRIWGATGGKFKITIGTKTTALLNWAATAAQVEWALNTQLDYFNAKVTRFLLDQNGITINTGTESGYLYNIKFLRYRSNQLLPLLDLSGLAGNPKFSKAQVIPPSSPIAGTFSIIYKMVQSADIPFNTSQTDIFNNLTSTFAFPKEITVTQSGFPEGDNGNGYTWTIYFYNTNGNIEDFTFDTSKLTGGNSGTSPTIILKEIIAGSYNQFFNPIPFDMIFTEVSKPQIIVKVNNVWGTCKIDSDCSYEIDVTKALTPQVETFTVTANGLTISIISPGSIQIKAEDISIEFAESSCTQVSLSSLIITCVIEKNQDGTLKMVAGSFKPIVHLLNIGYLNYAESLSDYDIPLTISSLTPTSGGDNGGTIVEISGTGFSLSKNSLSQMEVKFSTSKWEIISVENTKAILKTTKKNGNGNLIITLNGKTVSSTAFSYLNSGVPTITSISPKTLSPVQKADLTVTGLNFGIDKSKIRCVLDQESELNVYELPVFSVTDTSVVCVLEGGKSGSYSVRILKDPVGSSSVTSSQDNLFKYQFTVESISPSTGSRYGGTLLTITGTNFSPFMNQNQILIGAENILCDVKSTSITTLTCLTRPAPDSYLGQQNLVVQQRLLEVGICIGSCVFEYLCSVDSPEVISITSPCDIEQVSGDSITIIGINLLPSTSVITKIIFQPGNQATVDAKTNSDTEITFDFPSLAKGVSFFQVLIDNKGFSKVPSDFIFTTNVIFSSVSPTTGSLGGIILTINGNGFSKATTVIFSAANVGNCNIIAVLPTSITCLAPKNANDDVVLIDSKTNFTCIGCFYHGDSAKTPYVTAISANTVSPISDKFSLTFTGTGFTLDTISEIVLVTLEPVTNGVLKYSGLAKSTSATSVEAEFSNVPSGTSYNISILFNNIGYAFFNVANTVKVNLPLPTTTPVVSSYNGGKKLIFNGLGFILDSNFQNGNKITVCGTLCPVTSSTYSSLECEIPPLVTAKSDFTYSLGTGNSGLIFFETFNELSVPEASLNDDDTASVYDCNTVPCSVKFSFGDLHYALIDYIKFYPDIRLPATQFAGLIFEGSQDDIVYTFIKQTKEQELVSGWNYLYPDAVVSYKYIRIKQGTSSARIRFGEIKFVGKIYQDSTADLLSIKCEAKIKINGESQTLTDVVEYRSDATPILTNISPKYGSTLGNTDIMIIGSGFGTSVGAVSVVIDNIPCVVSTVTETNLVCKTGARPVKVSQSLSVKINEQKAAVIGASFLYIDLWSEPSTWGGEQPPREYLCNLNTDSKLSLFCNSRGESAYIPHGQAVLVDVSTPILYSVIIEGGIVFEDVPNLEFNAHIIICHMCFFQIGTEEAPHTNKLTITLYGKKSDKQLPIYGNKGLIIHQGQLDIHGVVRTPTWTLLAITATNGDSTIRLMAEVDWKVGEQIVIATTDWSLVQSETRYITQVSADRMTLTLDRALEFTHISVRDEYGPNKEYFMEMRAEVALLTRNIIFRGDENSQRDLYGAHMLIHGTDLEGTRARISYAEFYNTGQQTIIGRYPIHFHLCGEMRHSYVVGNAVHHSIARLVTVHGSRFLRIQKNIGFDIFGHQYFLEDGAETKNIIEDNVAINTKMVWTLIDTDVTAAAYYLTHPFNILRRNRAAGGEWYGFLYEFRTNPTGPSVNPSICPEGEILGEFSDNEAHSFLRYGLRVKTHWPRTFPCKPAVNFDSPNPFKDNPSQKAVYNNFIVWRNGEKGVQFEDAGHIWLENMKIADSKEGAIDIWTANVTYEGAAKIKNALIIGKSLGNPGSSGYTNGRGIILPRSNFFNVEDVVFINFDAQSQMTALAACSMCENISKKITGGKTTKFKNLIFLNVDHKIFWQGAKRDIFVDIDGSLTGLSSASAPYYLSPYYPHLLDTGKGCKRDDTPTKVFADSVICPKTAPIREILFFLPAPGDQFTGVQIYILRITPNINLATATKTDYVISDQLLTNSGDTPSSWGFSFVVGNTYNIHWDNNKDFVFLPLRASPEWLLNEKLILSFNFTSATEVFDVLVKTGTIVNNITQSKTELRISNSLLYGTNYLNSTIKTFFLGISGGTNGSIGISPVACRLTCNGQAPVPEIPLNPNIRLWSNVSMWPGGRLPLQGENVVILDEWQVLLDIDPPALGELRINGEYIFINLPIYKTHKGILQFDSRRYLNQLSASAIYIFRGRLVAGNETNPFTKKIEITLNGRKESPELQIDKNIEGGNKVLAVTGKLLLYGIEKKNPFSRLTSYAKKGSKQIELEVSVEGDWQPWDKIAIGPSDFTYGEYEILYIDYVLGRKIFLTSPLKYDHYGDPKTIETHAGSIDMRAVVGVLSRNIVIQGSYEGGGWGCHVLICKTSEIIGNSKIERNGEVQMKNVEIRACGQPNSVRAAIHFENSPGLNNSKIINSTIHSSYGWGLSMASSFNIDFSWNIIADSLKFAIKITQSNNFRISKNMIIGVRKRPEAANMLVWDSTAGLEMWDYIKTGSQILVNENIVQGVNGVGFLFPASVCGEKSGFYNNSGSSALVGWLVSTNGTGCINVSRFSAYKNTKGVIEYLTVTTVRASYLILAENKEAMSIMYGHEADDNRIEYSNIWIAALARPSCAECYPTIENCSNFRGIRIAVINQQGQPIPVTLSPYPDQFIIISTETAFEGRAYHINNTYVNFQDSYLNHSVTTWQKCNNNKVFTTYPGSPDASTTQILIDTDCVACDEDGLVEFLPPSDRWVGWLGGCGSMTCTGPNNLLISDISGRFLGKIAQAIPNNQISQARVCNEKPSWRGHICEGNDYTVLAFESIDANRRNRTYTPVTLTSGDLFKNELNMWREWAWEAGLPKDQRLARFWGVVLKNKYYNVTFPGSLPQDMRFLLQDTNYNTDFVIIRLVYDLLASVQVLVKGQVIQPYPISENVNLFSKTSTCGANIFNVENRTIEFVVNRNTDCIVRVRYVDAVKMSLRMDTTIEEFYHNNGVAAFVDTLVTFLGIEFSRLKIVNIRKGSVIVDFFIDAVASQPDTRSAGDLNKFVDKISEAAGSNSLPVNYTITELSATIFNSSTGRDNESYGFYSAYTSTKFIILNNNGTNSIILELERTEGTKLFEIISLVTAITFPFVFLIIVISLYMRRNFTKTAKLNTPFFNKNVHIKSSNSNQTPNKIVDFNRKSLRSNNVSTNNDQENNTKENMIITEIDIQEPMQLEELA